MVSTDVEGGIIKLSSNVCGRDGLCGLPWSWLRLRWRWRPRRRTRWRGIGNSQHRVQVPNFHFHERRMLKPADLCKLPPLHPIHLVSSPNPVKSSEFLSRFGQQLCTHTATSCTLGINSTLTLTKTVVPFLLRQLADSRAFRSAPPWAVPPITVLIPQSHSTRPSLQSPSSQPARAICAW